METKKANHLIAQKQKPVLAVKSNVKAGPEIIIIRQN
jgi:hypothetical protein